VKPGGVVAVFADAEAALVEEPSAHKVEGALAASIGARQCLMMGLQCEHRMGR